MKAISIVALGEVDEESLSAIEAGLWQAFGFDVRRADARPEPAGAYDAQRGQYSSVLILRDLLGYVSQGDVRLVGVTEKDLFIPMLSFVFGQAQLNGVAAVISLARLRQEFYGLPPSRPVLISRSVKEAIHEVGHTFGLTHCADSTCPMSLSNNVRQVDVKGEDLCRNCSIIFEENTNHIRSRIKPGAEVRK
ncbi:MAG: archaemetzincin family Zn-dependent metalloprotease [Bacteroidetes bacterium]|nr:archaemetzincin family Zn-dependent metalloprotease [Bacteroidota bacterium]MCW5894034.1 archaemetzincin family Zn-dependent metalloprotease [Bacteroidota bacterium]